MFTKPKRSSPRSQKPATSRCPEADGSSRHPSPLRYILILSPHLCLSLPSGLFPSGFVTRILYAFFYLLIRATCPAHLILSDLIILISFCEGCKLQINWYAIFCTVLSLQHSPSQFLKPIGFSSATHRTGIRMIPEDQTS